MNLCYSGMLEQLSLLLSEHCHLLVAVTAFLCKLVSERLLISFSPPEATLIDRLFPSIVEMFRINFYRVSLDFSLRNTKLIVVYVIERITTPIRNVHSR
jgi:hypothetical protein